MPPSSTTLATIQSLANIAAAGGVALGGGGAFLLGLKRRAMRVDITERIQDIAREALDDMSGQLHATRLEVADLRNSEAALVRIVAALLSHVLRLDEYVDADQAWHADTTDTRPAPTPPPRLDPVFVASANAATGRTSGQPWRRTA